MNRKIRIGMVGGGKDAFIGGVHRIAFVFIDVHSCCAIDTVTVVLRVTSSGADVEVLVQRSRYRDSGIEIEIQR